MSNISPILSEPQALNGKTPKTSPTTLNPPNKQTLANSDSKNCKETSATMEPFDLKDIHSLRFLIQFVFSTIILVFCVIKLSLPNKDHQDNAIYWGGVTSILALWMPSPSSLGPNIGPNINSNFGSVKNSPIEPGEDPT